MNVERLLAHFEDIADAPDAVGKLRRFILDLAVRGKLVPQDPNDEPASELLKRIALEKARLLKAGKIRTPKALLALPEPPFPTPSNWRWSQLAEIGVVSPRNEAPDALEASFVPMPLIAAEYGVANQHEIRSWGEIKKGYTHFAEGDVGLAKITPCFENGKSTVFRKLTGGVGAGTTELHIVRPLFVDQDYILLFLKSPHFIETGIPKMTGTAGQKRVSTEYFAYSPFPLPPLAEQHRIVAKVDELMALCGRLEAARAERESTRNRLSASSLARLNAPDPETFQADAHFVLATLPTLTTRPDQIKQLRQTILNLAVRGKLVPQDPNDEPASELLKRITAEKARLVKAGDIRKPKPTEPIRNEELPIRLPRNWACARLCEIGHLSGGMTPSMNRPDYWGGDIVWLSPKDIKSDQITDSELKISRLGLAETRLELYRPGCLFMVARSGILKRTFPVSINRVAAAANQDMKVLAPFLNGQERYLQIMLRGLTDFLLRELVKTGTTVQSLKYAEFEQQPFPLPPLAEQHRIVAKVDELMGLCEELEAKFSSNIAVRHDLLEVLLASARDTETSRELEAAE